MQNIQDAFNRIQEIKREQKTIRESYKDALNSTGEYQGIADQIKTLRERKKQIENATQNSMSGEFTKLGKLKAEMISQNEMISSIALSQYLKGEHIGITDKYENSYEPIFIVRFKKTNVV